MITVIALIIIVFLGINQKFHILPPRPPQVQDQVLGDTDPTSTPQPSSTPSETGPSTQSFTPTIKPLSTPTPTPNTSTSAILIYPGSAQTSSDTYTTSDPADKVIDWYKSQIESKNFNLKTFVTTTTNGNSKSVVKAEGQAGKVDLIILRSSSDTVTTIKFN